MIGAASSVDRMFQTRIRPSLHAATIISVSGWANIIFTETLGGRLIFGGFFRIFPDIIVSKETMYRFLCVEVEKMAKFSEKQRLEG